VRRRAPCAAAGVNFLFTGFSGSGTFVAGETQTVAGFFRVAVIVGREESHTAAACAESAFSFSNKE
jgi:hypothetical protein